MIERVISDLLVGGTNLLSGATIRWVGCEPATRQRIYFANHTSNLDFVAMWAALPPPIRVLTRPAAAHDYWTINRVRHYVAAKVFNAVLIERKKVTAHNNPIDQMLEAIGDMHSLIIFPEGRRNTQPEIGEFKSGLYHLGKKRPDIDLIPVHIDNLNRILPRGEVLPVPLLSCISFGTPIRVLENEKKTDFLVRAREEVIRLRHA